MAPLGIEDDYDADDVGSFIESNIKKRVTVTMTMDLKTLGTILGVFQIYNAEIGQKLPSGPPEKITQVGKDLHDIYQEARR